MTARAPASALALAVLAALAAGTARSDDPPDDPPANFLVDVTATAGAPTAFVLATEGGYWQLSNDHARRGYGMAFDLVAKPTESGSIGRVQFEVEALGSRTHAQAAADWETALPAMLGKGSFTLVGKVNRPGTVQPYVLGRTRVPGIRFDYSFIVKEADGKDAHHAYCVALVIGKAFVVVSTEKFGAKQSCYDQVIKSLSVVQPPAKPPDCRTLKVLNLARAPASYTLATVPERWTQDCSPASASLHSAWVRRDAATQRVAGRVSADATRAAADEELAHWLGEHRADYEKRFHDVTEPVAAKVGSLPGLSMSYVDKSDDRGQVFRVRRVFVKVRDTVWSWTVESDASDEAAAVEDGKKFDDLLTGVRTWSATK